MPRTDAFIVMVRRSLKVRPLKRVARIRSSTVETLILLLKYRVAVDALACCKGGVGKEDDGGASTTSIGIVANS